MTLVILGLIGAWALGYWMGKTRSRDRLPVEVYDRDGRRVN